MEKIKELILLKNFLTDFEFIFKDELILSYFGFLKALYNEKDLDIVLSKYSKFYEILSLKKVEDFSLYFKNIILKGKIVNKYNLKNEIEILNKFLNLNCSEIVKILEENFSDFAHIKSFFPSFNSSSTQICAQEIEFDETQHDIYSTSNAFIFDTDLEIKPVCTTEKTKFSDLKGYKKQKKVLYENTLALLEGKKVNNILLYGDAGCGKSTSVRALLNEFKDIKIVQIFKNNLVNLDKLYLKLQNSKHKFIIFADDISFKDTDESLSTMKAVLEGSLVQCPKNVVIYATSNRRHLIKESFKSRAGDEVHLNDTMNELNSLSDRFGINLFFAKPDNKEYINIVLELARDNGLDIDEKTLGEKAQRLALIKGSTSPRIAKQLIDNLAAGVEI